MPFQETNAELDRQIAICLSTGMTQDELVAHFKLQNITPNSKSAIEKKIKQMKADHGANTLFHLAVILKKKGWF